MIAVDTNILVYAHRSDAPNHTAMKKWLEAVLGGNEAFGVSDLVLSGFLRIVTHPSIFLPPSTMKAALEFCSQVRGQQHCMPISPGPRHWEIFTGLCKDAGVKGNLVPDAYLAALAIESGSEWISTDRDYSRFAKLRWRHPLE